MDSLLKGMFGGADDEDDNVRRGRAQDFVSRYETGRPEDGMDADEVRQHYGRVSQNIDDDTYERSAQEAYGRMSSDQRAQLGQMLQQRMGGSGQQIAGNVDDPRQLASLTSRFRKENPGGLESLFGGGGGGGGIGGMLGGILGGGGDDDNQRRGGGGGGGGMLDSPLAKAALGGIAAMAFKNMMDKR